MFSLGRTQPVSREQRRRNRRRHHQETKRKPITKQCSATFPRNKWLLLPKETFQSLGLFFWMSFDRDSFTQRYIECENLQTWFGKTPLHLSPEAIAMRAEAKEKYFVNQSLRFAFKRIYNAFLAKKIVVKNETDPITLEAPNQAVYIYDLPNRCKFQFEAKELLRDFQTRLLTHEDLFPTPLFLRNPLTNTKLSLGQILSIFHQIKQFGHSHWTLECFVDAMYCYGIFSRDNQRKLRLNALDNLIKSHNGVPFLLDFMEAQHDIFKKEFDERTYRWALETNKCHSMERIRSWKSLCHTFYVIEITEEDYFEREKKQRRLYPLLAKLCTPCLELLHVKRTCKTH